MTREEALALCEATVRRAEPDRYFASLFAPAEKRPLLFALYAFNHELTRIGETAREPMMAEIRLEWWREALDSAGEGRPRGHPAAIGLAEIFACAPPPRELFERVVDAHSVDTAPLPFSDFGSLEANAESSSAALMEIAAHVLDVWDEAHELSREAGIAYGLTANLRATPRNVARGRLTLPGDLLAAAGLSPADAVSGRNPDALRRVAAQVAERARTHYRRARGMRAPRAAFAAFLPASLVPAYLSRLTRMRTDPLREPHDISQLRRQLILLRAALLGRL
ncbi:MAG TPA: squalene/phytoene synthase family protein [Rhizomicrobium sp.]|jgi:phytoene synthase